MNGEGTSLLRQTYSGYIAVLYLAETEAHFYENPLCGSRVVLRGRTDVTKLKVAFCSFANAPKNGEIFHQFRNCKLLETVHQGLRLHSEILHFQAVFCMRVIIHLVVSGNATTSRALLSVIYM